MSRYHLSSRVSCILLILFSRWVSLVPAYSKPGISSRRQKLEHSLNPGVEKLGETGASDGLDRRRFFSTMIGLGSIGMAASDSLALDFGSKFSSTGNGGSTSSTPGVSKKAGGLANKIRGICLQMVGGGNRASFIMY